MYNTLIYCIAIFILLIFLYIILDEEDKEK